MKAFKSIYFICSLSLIISCGFWGCETEPVNKELQESLAKKRRTLPNGWSLSPAGHGSLSVGDLPLNTAVSSNHQWLAITNNGYGKQGLSLVNISKEAIVDSVALQRSWVGLSFGAGDSLLYASGGNNNDILIFALRNSRLVRKDSLILGEPWPQDKISPAGLAVDEQDQTLYTVTKEDSSLYVLDLENKAIVNRLQLKAEAYACLLSGNGTELYISLWGGHAVAVYDTKQNKIDTLISVEGHPNDMVLSKSGYLFVANANSNSVSVIDVTGRKVIETLNTALYPNAPAGSTPNSVALSEDGATLYVANADNNCLAVFDVTTPGQSRSKGFIPTAWYPTSVEKVDDKIIVTNGKGGRSEANPDGPQPGVNMTGSQYIAGLFTGNVTFISQPDQRDMATYSQAVYENTPYHKDQVSAASVSSDNPIPKTLKGDSPIKHVFYIIKENRTYDQVFGDIAGGNGDSTLTLFGENVTPNHHQLARDFVLLDNFYVDAEVSADGHNWSMGAYATDFVEKTWPTFYSGRGGSYDYEGSRDIASPEKGYIWNYCKQAGVSYRSYGEFAGLRKANLEVLKDHFDPSFPSFDLDIKDVDREKEWEHDFDSLLAKDAVPQFQTIRLPSDHTNGARAGKPTPDAYVADNDLALGRLIDHLSHSSIWKESAVFVVEDDAQNGPDHVDAHRSVCLVVSPYVKRNSMVHTMYSTTSVLRTMELILGLPPMSQYDAAATPMYDIFTAEIDTTTYDVLPSQVDLNKKNMADNSLSRQTKQFNLAVADAAPDVAFDEVIWKAMRGIDSEMPPPRHSAFLMIPEKGEGEKDWDD